MLDGKGQSALHIAGIPLVNCELMTAKLGYLECVQILLKFQVSLELQDEDVSINTLSVIKQ